jgi:hypothetical protein
MRTLIVALVVIVLISNVCHSAPMQTPKPSFDEQLYLCQKEAYTLLPYPPCSGDKCVTVAYGMLIRRQEFVQVCMKAHGYVVQYPEEKKP